MPALNANSARFLLSAADFSPEDFTVTKFTGADAVGRPYRFDIEFQLSEAALKKEKPPVLTSDSILGKPCRFELLRQSDNTTAAAYNGVAMGFGVEGRAKPLYSIRLVPWIELLSLNTNNRVFQRQDAVSIIKKVIMSSGIDGYCDFRYECERQYRPVDFCVQYQETDLNFISRLMERNGIWYYFEDSDSSSGKDAVVITDSFSKFPAKTIGVPFVENTGFAEISTRTGEDGGGEAGQGGESADGFGETVYSLSTKSSLIPKTVKLRAQNYRTPENLPEGGYEVSGSGRWGSVYEYGGAFRDSGEAAHGARLYLDRLRVENLRSEGMSGCTAFRAGRLVSIGPDVGGFLIVSVNHAGGIIERDGVYACTYNNSFSCIDSAPKIYAPPLTAAQPKAAGLITAPVEALGEEHPNIDEMGRYRVKLPFDAAETKAYGATKDIRLTQPSGGNTGGGNYGIHFPSKAGAEMVLACVDGNPDKPVGLGFVPNAAAPSNVNSENRDQNIIRTWGGNELVMDDTQGKEKITLSTVRQDGDTGKNCGITLSNEKNQIGVRAWKHKISMDCNQKESSISLKTLCKNSITLNDIMRRISIKTLTGCSIEVDDINDTISISNAYPMNLAHLAITLQRYCLDQITEGWVKDEVNKAVSQLLKDRLPRNKISMDGKEKKISIESGGGCALKMEDKKDSITVKCPGDKNIIAMDGQNSTITLSVKDGCAIAAGKSKITIVTGDGGKIILDNEKDLITVQNAGGANTVTLDGKKKKISLESKGDINIKAGGAVNISGKNLNMQSKNKMAVKSSNGVVEVKGKMIKLN
ncbi:MAG: type VI secretion system tip protein VgrG [Chitinispirillia bacterium]|nr:type VI secretion system tip protein VgrG [Chitinispirillia bacterium]MCL2242029.1 type VI secretion system tip protein VgrG [Chitinispirillia bacterium]